MLDVLVWMLHNRLVLSIKIYLFAPDRLDSRLVIFGRSMAVIVGVVRLVLVRVQLTILLPYLSPPVALIFQLYRFSKTSLLFVLLRGVMLLLLQLAHLRITTSTTIFGSLARVVFIIMLPRLANQLLLIHLRRLLTLVVFVPRIRQSFLKFSEVLRENYCFK